ncbi:hypothetical protein JYU29_06025 [Tianweitania sp. BSSL-BM11]|uniref:Uncharacterized protein n=1 Tax=Tianweitania aestuarii TaxID=2814886 RepID=A0ABS5RV95_9HYPH|nr:hypothetical protein [Tianweitania aestuarii]MBS9720242.1 hypothetical protein [Tianweitania aestuarii]
MSAADFPIPFPNQEPLDELVHAINLLEVMSWTLDNGLRHGISKEAVASLYSVYSDAKNSLDLIASFLDNLDYPGLIADFQAARRTELLKSWETRA